VNCLSTVKTGFSASRRLSMPSENRLSFMTSLGKPWYSMTPCGTGETSWLSTAKQMIPFEPGLAQASNIN
jgi:hypothetical protein